MKKRQTMLLLLLSAFSVVNGAVVTPNDSRFASEDIIFSDKMNLVTPQVTENSSSGVVFPRLSTLQPIEPSAASLGKYGEYAANNSNGLPDIRIPLYEVKSGSLSLPIELRYHGGGIKVNEEAGWVGLGWDLFYGGQVTRVVHGFPDEIEPNSSESPIPVADSIKALMYADPLNIEMGYLRNLSSDNNTYSYMPDEYYYNIGQENGKFVNKYGMARLPYKPVKIEAGIGGKYGINITNSQGDKYSFSESDVTETLSADHSYPAYVSSWQLNEICSADNNVIKYEYQKDGSYVNDKFSYYEGYVETIDEYYERSVYSTIPLSKSNMKLKVTSNKPKYIYFNGGRLCFELETRTDIYNQGIDSEIRRLKWIDIEEKQADCSYKSVKKITFYYSYFGQDRQTLTEKADYTRLKLDSIKESSSGYVKLIASFGYDSHSLPCKSSYSYDYCGYYNGSNNSTPIPRYYISAPGRNFTLGGGDKCIDEEYSKSGSLTSITYPTRGTTRFEWENNRYGADLPVYVCKTENLENVYLRDIGSCHDETEHYCTKKITPDDELSPCDIDSYKVIKSFVDQTVCVNYFLYQLNSNDLVHRKYDEGSISIRDLTTNTGIWSCGALDKVTQQQINIDLRANHSYEITVYTNCHNVYASVDFNYNAYNPQSDRNNYLFGGLRIKKIKNFDSNQTLLNQKEFTYHLSGDTYKSSGYITNVETVLNSSTTNLLNCLNLPFDISGLVCTDQYTRTYLYYDNPLTGIYSNNISYEYVQEKQISVNSLNNGFKESEFRTSIDSYVEKGIPVISRSDERGQLIRETVFDNANKKVLETKNYYSLDNRVSEKCKGFKLIKYIDVGSNCVASYGPTLSEVYNPIEYAYESVWCRLDSTVKCDYISKDFVKEKTIYAYDDLKGCQPTKIIRMTSRNKQFTTSYLYPAQLISDNVYAGMVNANILAPVIIEEKSLNGSSLSLQKNNYIYKNGNNTDIIVLNNIEAKKGNNPLEKRITINKYDNWGNILEYQQDESIPITCLWSYSHQRMIAKIENASYSDVEDALLSLGINATGLPEMIEPDMSLINSLRKKLPQAQITTFSYKPLYGITSITNPAGIVTNYFYDGLGRLESVKDCLGNIIQSYGYNYETK
jgi:YD repeat-containing protein